MAKTRLHQLSAKYPNKDLRRMGWAKKKTYKNGKWHWVITQKGINALRRNKR